MPAVPGRIGRQLREKCPDEKALAVACPAGAAVRAGSRHRAPLADGLSERANVKLTFVGGGNMAAALIGGLLKRDWLVSAMQVVEIAEEARRALKQRYGVDAFGQLPAALADEDVVLLAVKPQQLRTVALQLRDVLRGQLVITIAAGIRTRDLSRWLGGHARIIRAMPNTPALVGAGITALFAPPAASGEDRRQADAILSAVGSALWVEREDLMDAVTAVSGSGPAYVFYFMEAVMLAAAELGLDPAQARALTLETFYGAASLARQSEETPATLRERVTSKRGTTERALEHMQRDQIRARVSEAVKQAAQRSRELGDELGQD
jgi:pyrroline-5-carboxylate reductase